MHLLRSDSARVEKLATQNKNNNLIYNNEITISLILDWSMTFACKGLEIGAKVHMHDSYNKIQKGNVFLSTEKRSCVPRTPHQSFYSHSQAEFALPVHSNVKSTWTGDKTRLATCNLDQERHKVNT